MNQGRKFLGPPLTKNDSCSRRRPLAETIRKVLDAIDLKVLNVSKGIEQIIHNPFSLNCGSEANPIQHLINILLVLR